MRFIHQTALKTLTLLSAANFAGAAAIELPGQKIALPAGASAWRFLDLDADKLSELLVVEPSKLLIYRQRVSGLANAVDQVFDLPPATAWITVCDVDAHPGPELLMSTAEGLLYCRQNGGVLEGKPRVLIEAGQVFTNASTTTLLWDTPPGVKTNDLLPVISATQAVFYRRTNAVQWAIGERLQLLPQQTTSHVERSEWMFGGSSSHGMSLRRTFQAERPGHSSNEPENDAIRKILSRMKQTNVNFASGQDRRDINGDGREDLVLWHLSGQFNPKTDVHIFLRGADNLLPQQETQALRYPGLPILAGTHQTPVCDLNGDATCELVLLELAGSITSASDAMEMLLSRGMDFNLTVRPFQAGSFSSNRQASLKFTAILSLEEMGYWAILLRGDFNGDGRIDLVVQRSASRWMIFPSTADGTWFAREATMTFETPVLGDLHMIDLNLDGRSEVILEPWDEASLVVYWPPSPSGSKRSSP